MTLDPRPDQADEPVLHGLRVRVPARDDAVVREVPVARARQGRPRRIFCAHLPSSMLRSADETCRQDGACGTSTRCHEFGNQTSPGA